jgi:oligopeptide/dipeptide ABC transporter ATP-binding protein
MNAATQSQVTKEPVANASAPVLEVAGLTISVRGEDDEREVVSELSFSLARGTTLCIAGESGSGKSMTSLGIMGLLPEPAAHVSAGSIRLGELDLAKLPESRMRRIRGNRIAMIFQEPMTSLNPVLSIGRQLIEAIEVHTPLSRREARQRAIEALRSVRISEAERRLAQYPHELSGGMRQRVMIAMALALKPDILIADEPTTALDVTVQKQILDLLERIQHERRMAMILITHDLGVVAGYADEVAVMYAGQFVERAPTKRLFANVEHPYTEALLGSIPRIELPSHTRFDAIAGRPPDMVKPPPGCRFAPRCRYAQDECRAALPPLEPVDSSDHPFRCYFPVGRSGSGAAPASGATVSVSAAASG